MDLSRAFFNLGYLDRLSYQDTFMHRLDPRAKVVFTLAFLVSVVSYPSHEVSALLPFALFPVLFMTLGDIPPGFVLKRILLVSPFVLLVGVFNPFLDTRVALHVHGVPVSAGWVSFISIIVKFALTISAAILLVATTSMPAICNALRRLGMPRPFTTQIVFLYRYMFVLIEEALRLMRARQQRSFGHRGGLGAGLYIRLMGMLFIRTVERAERIYGAMVDRGFRGEMPQAHEPRPGPGGFVFMAMALALLACMRLLPVTGAIGSFVLEMLGRAAG